MNFKLVFVSPNGTTKATSMILKKIIEKYSNSVELIDIGSGAYRNDLTAVIKELKGADIVGFGAPAYHMNMLSPMLKLFDEMSESGSTFKFKSFLYLNYAGITSGKAFLNASRTFKKMSIPIIGAMKISAPHFHHNEKFPAENTEDFIENFFCEMQKNEFEAIEWGRLEAIFAPKKFRVNLLYPLVHFIGKKRELPININTEKCKKCGKCARECPVGAISMDNLASIDFDKCIHCYHCSVACAFKAVEAPVERLDDMIRMNKKIIGTEKPLSEVYI